MNRTIALVPQPAHLVETGGALRIADSVPLRFDPANPEVRGIAEYLTAECRRQCRLNLLPVTPTDSSATPAISLAILEDQALDREGMYRLTVQEDGISVQAGRPSGLFYAAQSLIQHAAADKHQRGEIALPCMAITDWPRFSWRGMHLDVSRHFFPVEFIKKYIDLLAFHKMNVFHWHLTDDQGWRIEIKRYPRLTEIGGWRTEPDGQQYGGFYSQEEIRGIVAHAKSRFVTIVPEIELPGHASAALAAYPELSCTGGPFKVETRWGVFDDVYCAGNDASFSFLQNVLAEVAAMFPGQFIHIGGDECPKVRWHSHDLCQRRMKDYHLATEDDLQAYFVSRVARQLEALGKRLVGWDEILDGGAPSNGTIMAWRSVQKGIEAARAGHNVVMTPMSHCYFDHYQGKTNEPKAIGGFTPLETVYEFEPIPSDLPPELAQLVIGAQGNVWTEYMHSADHVEYMVFPRLCALSEVLWSPREARSLPDFLERLKQHLRRLEARGVAYRRSED
jgi:hexosaminidase